MPSAGIPEPGAISASIGITTFPNDAIDAATLLKNADAAMYRAKEQGKQHFQFFTAEMNAEIEERMILINGLNMALEREEFVLHYQPKVDLRNGRLTGAEALLRWRHPERGLLAPDQFLDVAEQSMQRKAIVYDATGDEHYDAASALIKSMRGSDPDAAVYWVARMLEAGEDPRFIARRIAILASEDIGNADPRALLVASAAYDVVERIGMPEAQLTLGQAAIYMATAPKSNASALAIWSAMSDVKNGRTLPVPKHLKDTHYAGSKRLGHGTEYKYAHDFEGGFVRQDYLGVDKRYYEPTDRGFEADIARRLVALRDMQAEEKTDTPEQG